MRAVDSRVFWFMGWDKEKEQRDAMLNKMGLDGGARTHTRRRKT
jgi:hypothetical protein